MEFPGQSNIPTNIIELALHVHTEDFSVLWKKNSFAFVCSSLLNFPLLERVFWGGLEVKAHSETS